MIRGSIRNLKEYVERKCLAIVGVNKFLYGNAKKIETYSRSNAGFGYPLAHMIRPIIVETDNGMGNIQTAFYTEICIIGKVDKSGASADYDELELDVEDMTLSMLLELSRLFRLDNRKGDIEYLEGVEIEPTMNNFIDSHTGWKLSVKIVLGANSKLCK